MHNLLFQVRDVLREFGSATSAQVAARLALQPAVVESMLEHWVSRRAAQADDARGGCRSGGCAACGGCAPATPAARVYRWRDAGPTPDQAGKPIRRVLPIHCID